MLVAPLSARGCKHMMASTPYPPGLSRSDTEGSSPETSTVSRERRRVALACREMLATICEVLDSKLQHVHDKIDHVYALNAQLHSEMALIRTQLTPPVLPVGCPLSRPVPTWCFVSDSKSDMAYSEPEAETSPLKQSFIQMEPIVEQQCCNEFYEVSVQEASTQTHCVTSRCIEFHETGSFSDELLNTSDILSSLAVDTDAVQEDIRLCKLRVAKLEQQLEIVSNSIMRECSSLGADDSYASLIEEDAHDLCNSIEELLRSPHTSGVWSNGAAVKDIMMNTFGREEGEAAVEEHMQILGISPCEQMRPILQIALLMVINNRSEFDEEGCERL